MKSIKSRFDERVTDIIDQLLEADGAGIAAVAASNISPEAGKKLIQTFKQNVLLPLKNGKQINELDKTQVQAAINGGLIDPKTGAVSDSAIPHINADPDLTGHFLPASDTAQKSAQPQPQQQPVAQQPQNPTTSKSTSKPSTNQAGVVSSVYKIQ